MTLRSIIGGLATADAGVRSTGYGKQMSGYVSRCGLRRCRPCAAGSNCMSWAALKRSRAAWRTTLWVGGMVYVAREPKGRSVVDERSSCGIRGSCAAAMGIVTQWVIRLQTSDFYGPSPPTPNTQAPHDRPPPPPISDSWTSGKWENMEPRKTFNMGESIVPPPFRIIKVQPPPPTTTHIGTSLQENGDKRAVSPPPNPHRDTGTSLQENGGLGKRCVHVCMSCCLLSSRLQRYVR